MLRDEIQVTCVTRGCLISVIEYVIDPDFHAPAIVKASIVSMLS